MIWVASEAAVNWRNQPFIIGRHRSSGTEDPIDNINLDSEASLYQIPIGHAADINETVSEARQCLHDGCRADIPPLRCGGILRKSVELIANNIAAWMTAHGRRSGSLGSS